MRPIDRSVQIFKDLGWDTAAREDAPILSLGTNDQQRAALAGLQKGTPSVDVDPGMLGMFAIRLGVNGRRAAELAKGSDQALLDCLLQRDEDFALAFAERACWLWANADAMSENVAVGLILKHGLEMPYTLPCLEAWTVTAHQGLTGQTPGRGSWIPSLDDLRPSFATHLRAALELGGSVDGPLGAVLLMGVQQGLISRCNVSGHRSYDVPTFFMPWGFDVSGHRSAFSGDVSGHRSVFQASQGLPRNALLALRPRRSPGLFCFAASVAHCHRLSQVTAQPPP